MFNNALPVGIRFIGGGGTSVEFGGWAIIFAQASLLIVGIAAAFIFGGDNRAKQWVSTGNHAGALHPANCKPGG